MDCQAFQNWLLGSEDRRTLPADMAEHLQGCAPCRQTVQELDALENAWRLVPLVADPQPSQKAFLAPVLRPRRNASCS